MKAKWISCSFVVSGWEMCQLEINYTITLYGACCSKLHHYFCSQGCNLRQNNLSKGVSIFSGDNGDNSIYFSFLLIHKCLVKSDFVLCNPGIFKRRLSIFEYIDKSKGIERTDVTWIPVQSFMIHINKFEGFCKKYNSNIYRAIAGYVGDFWKIA